MLSPLTKEQRIKVEENMGLVGKVIQDCVHTLGAGSMFGYDDLFQIGCLGLCKAAQTDKPGHPPGGGGRWPLTLLNCPARCWTMMYQNSERHVCRYCSGWSGQKPRPPG